MCSSGALHCAYTNVEWCVSTVCFLGRPGIWFAMISHVVCGSQQQLCCKFACAATLNATGFGHSLGFDSASCSCECVVLSTWMPSSSRFDVVLWCDGASFVLVPLSAVQPPSAHFVLFSVQSLSEVALGWFVSPAMMLLSVHRVFFSERCVAEAVPCCYENALKFQVSELGLGRYENELKSLVSESAPGWPEAALLAAEVRAATLFVSFTPVCFPIL